VIFDKLKASGTATKTCNELIKKHGDKPVVILFARAMHRKKFLDVKHNQIRHCEDLRTPLPSNNWPRSHWEDLFEMLYERFHDQVTFAIGGTKSGNCLLSTSDKYHDVIDLTNVNTAQSLDVTIAMLNSALCSISSQSGPTHLSVQCGCPSFIYGHEQQRHSVDDNPLKTDVVFLETQLGMYNDSPEVLYKDSAVYIKYLLDEKNKGNNNVEAKAEQIQSIKKIGMVGVFDVKGSTNIPLGKAFANAGYHVDAFNYRTVAKNIGWDAMNLEIVKFASAYDLIIFCKTNGVTAETIRMCGRNSLTCWYFMDSVDHIKADPHYYKMANSVDFSVVTTMAVYDTLANGEEYHIPSVYHILQGIDPKEFYPVEAEKKYDVVFIGQRTAKRDSILATIEKAGYSTKAYGYGYNKPVYGDDFNRACAEGKILLAINNSDPNQDSFSDRIMRYMSTKGCVLTEYSKGLENYFHSEIEWFKNEKQLIDEIALLLKNDILRNSVIENGYKKVLSEHTWNKVAERIIKIATGEERNV